MACLGQCNDCNCKDLNICADTNVIEKQMNDYISQLKDAECEIRKTPCNKIQYAVANFSNKMWCVSKNNFKLSVNNTYRIDGLCETQKCIIDYLKKLSEYLKAQMQSNIEFSINSKAESDGVATTMKSSTSPDGTFKFSFDTNDGSKNIGNGEINGKVDHEYSSNEDGSIKVKVKSITINNVKWDKTADNSASNKNISLHIKDVNGNALYDKNYDGSTSWSEDVNKTVDLNIEKDVQPSSSSGDIQVLTIDDNWIFNTHGNASVKYDNNNKGAIPPEVKCEANCDKCKDKNSEDNKTEDSEIPIAPPIEQPKPVEKTKKIISESPNLVVTETDDAYKLTLNEKDNPDKVTVYDDTELRNKVKALENKKLKYRFLERSIGTTPFTFSINNNDITFNLNSNVDKEKDKIYVSFRTVSLTVPVYKDDSTTLSRDIDSLVELSLNGSTDRYINTQILLKNGDIIYISFKYDINGSKIYLKDFTSFIDAGKITGKSKMVAYKFFHNLGRLDFEIDGKQYYITTNHWNSMDIFKRTLEITEDN